MDLLDIRLYVRRVLNEEGESESYYSDDELNRYINEGYKEFVNIFPLPQLLIELYSTSTIPIQMGVDHYTLPADFARIVSLTSGNINYDILHPDYTGAFQNNRNLTFTSFYPMCYTMGNDIKMVPAPTANGIAVLTYIKNPMNLSNDTDVPEVNSRWHEYIALLACERAKIKDNEFEEANYHYQRAIDRINKVLGIRNEEVKK